MRRRAGLRASVVFITSLAIALTPACLIVPHPVPAQVDRAEDVYLADDVLVSAGPRMLLAKLSRRLEEANPDLEIMDPIAFRDGAFPDGGWRLADLLEADRCQRVAEDLGVEMLVLVGGGASIMRDEMGIMAPLMMPLGAMTMHETSVLSAVLIDLERGVPACRLRSEGDGYGVMLLWVVFAAANMPLTNLAAQRGLADGIAEAIVEEVGRRPLHIAVMAAEASGDPFVAWEGAPVSVGRDIAVGEMVNRLAEIEEDVARGVTPQASIRAELGEPMATHDGLRLDLYRFAAVAERETRPLIAEADFDWLAREARPYAGYLFVSYDEARRVVDLDSVVIAAEPPPPEWAGGLQSEDRSAYEYTFESSATTSVNGFRLEVGHLGESTRETILSETDETILFEQGEWSSGADGLR